MKAEGLCKKQCSVDCLDLECDDGDYTYDRSKKLFPDANMIQPKYQMLDAIRLPARLRWWRLSQESKAVDLSEIKK